MTDLEGVIMRGVRPSANALPTWQFLCAPVEILAGGELSVAMEAMVWGERKHAQVFSYEQADRLARLMTNEVTHVYPAVVSPEPAHPSAHVARPADYARGSQAGHEVREDWHARAKNCGVD